MQLNIERKPYLNLGCGKTHLPSAKPPGHNAVDDAIYSYPSWVNVDKVEGVGADLTFDLFRFPWPLPDNCFDGALLAHIAEHIPHEIQRSFDVFLDDERQEEHENRWQRLCRLQDAWYAFFGELHRVLTPGAIVHLVSPYGWSDGGITDPTHTRLLTINTFTHGLQSGDSETFKYETACNFKIAAPPTYTPTPLYAHLANSPDMFQHAMMTQLNVVYDFYIQLQAVK